MKICFFTKYPPIEGGVSAQTYWLSKALGEKGVEIHIVTNSLEVENEYKENIDWENLDDLSKYQPQNVLVHNLSSNARAHNRFFHIPQSPAYLERLINKGLEVFINHRCDLIDSFYLLPYGLAGFFVKILTGKPQIFRHAGSDVSRLFLNPELTKIFQVALNNADRIVISQGGANFFQQLGINASRLHFQKLWMPYPAAFNPDVSSADLNELGINISEEIPVITYIGKYNKQFKGLYELTEILKIIRQKFFLMLVTSGGSVTEFESHLKKFKNLEGKYKILGFVPPWRIPAIIKRSSCVIQLEKDFPIAAHHPIQLQETMAVGKTCLISDELYEKFREKFKLEDGKNVLVANPKDQNQLKEKLKLILSKPELLEKIGREAHNTIDWQKEFDEYLRNNIDLYEEMADAKHSSIEKALKLYDRIFQKTS